MLQTHAVELELLAGAEELPAHATQLELFAAEYVATGHSVHVPEPLVFLYVPARHVVHVPPSAPLKPALQTQAVFTVLPLGELELPGHATQFDSSVAPAVGEYFPVAQLVQDVEPIVFE